jgi:hypothetical protein
MNALGPLKKNFLIVVEECNDGKAKNKKKLVPDLPH